MIHTNLDIDIYQLLYGGTPVLALHIDGRLWFNMAEICLALRITSMCRQTTILDPDQHDIIALPQADEGTNLEIINLSGVYTLLFTNRPETAKPFTKWIAQAGSYRAAHATRLTAGHQSAAFAAPLF